MLTDMLNKSKNRKWEKRPQLYKGRMFYLKRSLQIGGAALALLMIGSTYLYFKKSDTLFVRHVMVTGNMKHLSPDIVLAITGLKKTDKLFDVDLTTISHNVHRHPWVEDVLIRREFPDTVQIHIEERQAVATLHVDDFYLTDSRGMVFKKMESSDDHNLPVITGLTKTIVEKYPNLSHQYLKETLDFLSLIQDLDFYKKYGVSEINFDAVFGFTVYTGSGQFEIYYGRNDILSKHKKLEKFVGSELFMADKILRLDLNARDKIVARLL